MRAAARKPAIAATSCATCSRATTAILPASIIVSSPLGRACETMELARAALGLGAQDYRREPRLSEIAFGDWEGFTIAQLHERDPTRIAQREHDKWHFVPPGGESYEMVSARMREWYESLSRDTVAIAHGGTARGLIAHLGIAKPAAAPLLDIEQGMVYVFEGENLHALRLI